MYIIAPDVPQPSSGSEDAGLENSTLLHPVRGDASVDTLSLREALGTAAFKISDFDIRTHGPTIVFSRLIVFEVFLKSFPAYENAHAWSQLQINCNSLYDPFDLAWRLVRLDPNSYREYAQGWATRQTHDLIWCIDEVQVALENRIGEELLRNIWLQILNFIPENENDSRIILSGTSLRLKDVTRVVEAWAEPYDEVPGLDPVWTDLWMTYSTTKRLPRIDETSLFWRLYQQHIHGIIEESAKIRHGDQGLQSDAGRPLRTRAGRSLGFELDLLKLTILEQLIRINDFWDRGQPAGQDPYLATIYTAINNHCPMFFGRYRWSTLFIEQILKQAVISIQENRTMDENSIFNAAKLAAQVAVKALRTQLSRIQDKSWAEDLYWMAIRADVFSQSSVIEDTTAQLVSEGFTLVEELQIAKDSTSNDSGPDS